MTGQFLSVDPLVDETGQPYAYTGDDPVDGVDPMGLWPSLGDLNPVHDAEALGHDAATAWNDTGGKVVSYVASHPLQTVGLVLGTLALATGVGAAVDVTLVLGDLTVSSSSLALTSFVAGSIGSGLDGPACLDRNDPGACAGFYLNIGSTLVGGAGSLAGLLTEEGASMLLPKIFEWGAVGLGVGGLGSDILFNSFVDCELK